MVVSNNSTINNNNITNGIAGIRIERATSDPSITWITLSISSISYMIASSISHNSNSIPIIIPTNNINPVIESQELTLDSDYSSQDRFNEFASRAAIAGARTADPPIAKEGIMVPSTTTVMGLISANSSHVQIVLQLTTISELLALATLRRSRYVRLSVPSVSIANAMAIATQDNFV